MRALCGTYWGSDPKTLQIVHNGLIQSHLDYGCQILSDCAKALINRLDKSQYKSIRIITGCMRSTPIHALLGKSGQIPLKYRWEWLNSKFLLKNLMLINSPIISALNQLQISIQSNHNYWNKKSIPLLVSIMNKFQHTPNLFSSELEYQLTSIPIRNVQSNKGDEHAIIQFQRISLDNPPHTIIFTDGSVDSKGSAGFGVFCPDFEYSYSSKLPTQTQVCTANAHHAIQFVLEKDIKRALILSDSKSGIQKIGKTSYSMETEHTSIMTKRGIIEANQQNISIILAWIPGHSDIKGNCVAEKLANIGRSLKMPAKVKLHYSNNLFYIKKLIWTRWAQEWNSNRSKGSFYSKIVNKWNKSPWFNQFPYKDRRHITAVIRMRTGHFSTPVHLFRIGIQDNPYCECGQIGSLNHVILECPINVSPNFDLYKELVKTKLQTPIEICSLLSNLNSQRLKLLITFLNLAKINL
ncbi:uncharacterized protein [Diabrotica undecimpunctata]|uniref:uncharacterized protein n=1 Tax=Diabrotica undecimpunctata TaxID=50387 RepID=UPI003B6376D9